MGKDTAAITAGMWRSRVKVHYIIPNRALNDEPQCETTIHILSQDFSPHAAELDGLFCF